MTERTSNVSGKIFGLIVLIASLVIAVASLYLVLTELEVRGSDPITIGLSAVVVILILLIVSMIWSISKGLRTDKDEGSG